MGRNVVSAKLDIIFKKIFTENADMLHEFIADILEIPSESIKEITIRNQELSPDNPEGKFSRLDLNLKVDENLVNVEIQLKGEPDFRDRALFYWSKLYASELKSGDAYGQLKKAITINIINFNMFEGNDYHTEIVTAIKGTDKIYSDKFNMHFFELKKVNPKVNPNNRRELWMQFLNADSEEDFEMLKETNVPIINKAVKVIYDLSEDTRIREAARIREKALHDEASALANAKNEGIAEGMAQGMAQGMAKGMAKGRIDGIAEGEASVIAKMRAFGMSDEEINAILSGGH